MTIHTVCGRSALDQPDVSQREQEAIATELNNGVEAVAWVPGWLADQESLPTVDIWYRLVRLREAHEYSDDALKVVLAEPTPDGSRQVFLPKGSVHVFRLADETVPITAGETA